MISKTQNAGGKGIGSISDPGECGCSGGVDTPSARAATAAIMGEGMDISKLDLVHFLIGGIEFFLAGEA
jgi:hypothetical protein